jgi:hypothetical protein
MSIWCTPSTPSTTTRQLPVKKAKSQKSFLDQRSRNVWIRGDTDIVREIGKAIVFFVPTETEHRAALKMSEDGQTG